MPRSYQVRDPKVKGKCHHKIGHSNCLRKTRCGPEAGRSVLARELLQPVVPLRFGVTETPQSTGEIDTNSRPSHQHIVHFLEDEEIIKKVPSMLPLLTGSVRSPRIAVSIEEQEIIVLLDTGAEVSVLPKSVMSELIGDGSRHVKLGESKSVKPFANADVTIQGPWCLSVVVCGVKITHPFYSMNADVPAVVGIDLLTVAKLVIDVKNRCVYSHHHAYLEVDPATSECEPILRVENASTFTHPPPTTWTSSSAQTDLTYVSTELCDVSPTGLAPLLRLRLLTRLRVPYFLTRRRHSPRRLLSRVLRVTKSSPV